MDLLTLGILTTLLACDTEVKEQSADTAEDIQIYVDADGDGYTAENDCDDSNSSVNPQAEEICDGVDNDCNGEVDDGVGDMYFTDADGDGFGDPEAMVQLCDTPPEDSELVENADDCDDTDELTFPDSDELCDEKDNDCDALIDEELNYDYYLDADGDGFGTEDVYVYDCAPGEGYVANTEDCNDANANVSPLVEEICDDIDNDCNGEVDDGVGTLWYVDMDGDQVGDVNGFVYSCEQPNGYAPTFGDCDDIDSVTYPGADELCDDVDNDCDGEIDELGAINETIWYQDADGDGYGDIAVTVSACNQPAGYVLNASDCLDVYASMYPGAPDLCDGLINDCTQLNLIDVESDLDGDGFVECTIDASGWMGDGTIVGGEDCDDTDGSVSPVAIELCDGIVNVCGGSLSGDETDDDGDGYVECLIDSFGWQGDISVVGGGDCDDTQASVAPTGVELCDGLANLCGSVPSFEIDDDGDGYVECAIDSGGWQGDSSVIGGEDCDDTVYSISPGFIEVCDGIDNNCNGQVDEGLLNIYYYDGDGDGMGNPNATTQACSVPGGYVVNSDDCNDGNASVYTGAPEVCDGFDNDCDGTIDESLLSTYYLDNDGDGLGNANVTASACSLPGGFVANDDDCNDSNANATHIGSDSSCARSSCLALHNEDSALTTGDYWIQPNSSSAYQATCDMSIDGGGWTKVSFSDAHTYLSGSMTNVEAANTRGIDAATGPYTRDGSSNHTHYYTFTFSSGFSEFRFDDYKIRANAGNGHTSDLNPGQFIANSWSKGYNGCYGDVALGAVVVGPQISLANTNGTASCKNCTYTLSNNTYNVGQNATKFRVVWGEGCGESEGWKPWYSGSVYIR